MPRNLIPKDTLSLLLPLTKRWEGCHRVDRNRRVYPYLDPVGLLTIGYGHLITAKEKPAPGRTVFDKGLTRIEVEALLRIDLAKAADGVWALCPRLLLEGAGIQAAIIDFTFNLGVGRLRASTLRRKMNAPGPVDYEEVAYQLGRWVKAGGRTLVGLRLRREAEVALFLGREQP